MTIRVSVALRLSAQRLRLYNNWSMHDATTLTRPRFLSRPQVRYQERCTTVTRSTWHAIFAMVAETKDERAITSIGYHRTWVCRSSCHVRRPDRQIGVPEEITRSRDCGKQLYSRHQPQSLSSSHSLLILLTSRFPQYEVGHFFSTTCSSSESNFSVIVRSVKSSFALGNH